MSASYDAWSRRLRPKVTNCLGVLHHLADPRAAFARRFRAMALRLASALRRATVRLPHWLLRPLCYPVAALLFGLIVLPGAAGDRRGVGTLADLPLEPYRRSPLRGLWLDTFDRLSAPLEHRYTWDDVRPWLDEAGLDVLVVRTWGGLMITARKR